MYLGEAKRSRITGAFFYLCGYLLSCLRAPRLCEQYSEIYSSRDGS